MVRGNHEFKRVNISQGSCGFNKACESIFGPVEGLKLFEVLSHVFEWMPLSALVSSSILVLHGGIGDGSITLQDLNRIPRPLQDDLLDNIVANVLWSDPSESDSVMDRYLISYL